jgi:phosphoenolpyruvate-protein phosphotransferase (PTS system enzyme I)
MVVLTRGNEVVTEQDNLPQSSSRRPVLLDGIAGSPGLVIGRAMVIETLRPGVVHRRVAKHEAQEEVQRYLVAVGAAAAELQEAASRAVGGPVEASILQAYVLMVQDQTLREEVERLILLDLVCAEWAIDIAADRMAAQMAQAPEPYLAERSHDVQFVGDRILAILSGRRARVTLPETDEMWVIIAHDLSPAETASFSRDQVMAIVTEVGTRTSHTAIVARALEIPAVVGTVGVLQHVANNDIVVVDGLRGRVVVSPTPDLIEAAKSRADRYSALTRELRELRDRPATTRCGVQVHLRANIELPAEADVAIAHGAEGVGLYRTEFLYVGRSEPPSEEEQYATYRHVLEAVAPLPVTIRTFDIGGDKLVPSLQGPQGANPALGLRAVRLGLARPELFLAQLRPLVRASAHGRLQIMIPLISSVAEFRATLRLLAQAVNDIDSLGMPRAAFIPCGCMVEVPSAAIMANELAQESAFLSIGTNDLVQYSLAVDRSRPELVGIGSSFDPAVLRLIRRTVRAGDRHHRPVTICGAMASDPLAVPLLLGLGLRDFSMEGSAIPELKEAISRISLVDAEQLADSALACATAEEVERMVTASYAPCFADLLDGEPVLYGSQS